MTFSIWHWLIVLAIVASVYAPLIIAVATERSGRRASRRTYLLAFLVGMVVPVASTMLLEGRTDDQQVFLVWLVVVVAIQAWFYRVLVRRARDAGHAKSLAYWALFPIIGFFICVYLLFPAGTLAKPPASE